MPRSSAPPSRREAAARARAPRLPQHFRVGGGARRGGWCVTLPEGSGPLGACYCSRLALRPPLRPSAGASGSGGRRAASEREIKRAADRGGRRRGGGRRERPLTVSNSPQREPGQRGRGESARITKERARGGGGRPWPTRISSSTSSSGTRVSGGGRGRAERARGPAPRSHFRSAGVADVVALRAGRRLPAPAPGPARGLRPPLGLGARRRLAAPLAALPAASGGPSGGCHRGARAWTPPRPRAAIGGRRAVAASSPLRCPEECGKKASSPPRFLYFFPR